MTARNVRHVRTPALDCFRSPLMRKDLSGKVACKWSGYWPAHSTPILVDVIGSAERQQYTKLCSNYARVGRGICRYYIYIPRQRNVLSAVSSLYYSNASLISETVFQPVGFAGRPQYDAGFLRVSDRGMARRIQQPEHLLGSNFLPDIEQSWEPQGLILRLHIKNTNRKHNRINRLLATLHLICTLR